MKNTYKNDKVIVLRDSTLREGLEMPQTKLSERDKVEVFKYLVNIGISEFEIIGPYDSSTGLSLLTHLNHFPEIKKSAIVHLDCIDIVSRCNEFLGLGINHVDLLLHISGIRLREVFPVKFKFDSHIIVERFKKKFAKAKKIGYSTVGIGLGDAFRAKPTFLCSLIKELTTLRPDRFVLYDTVGFALPSQVSNLIRSLSQKTSIPLYCHFHNDMGMATANTIIAIESGASGVDVTVGGIGDRSGNASLEETALIAEYRLGFKTGIKLSQLTYTSQAIQNIFGLLGKQSQPVVGDFAFLHSTPSHFRAILTGKHNAYEAYWPEVVGQVRRFQIDDSQEFTSAIKEWCTRKGIDNYHVNSIAKHNQGRIVTEEQLMELLNEV